MKVLVIGSNGFLGRHLVRELRTDNQLDVYDASHENGAKITVDLLDKTTIKNALERFRPDVIVNCAGIVANDITAYKNVEFCRNLFEVIAQSEHPFPKVIITGSASEYGVVGNKDMISETAPLKPTSDYGISKMQEEETAAKFSKEFNINVVVARIFNPIGSGMGDKFLITNLLRQVNEVKNHLSDSIEISRLDSFRDYIDIRDAVSALHNMVVIDRVGYMAVNIGSGKATSNGEILENILRLVELDEKPTIIETRTEPEPLYASCADISRIKSEYNWEPKYDLVSTIEEIIHESGK